MSAQLQETQVRVTGPASFEGLCPPCGLSFTGLAGSKAMRAHVNEFHPRPSWSRREKSYDTPVWANGKPYAWVAPKPSKVHTLEETLAKWADYGVEVLAS